MNDQPQPSHQDIIARCILRAMARASQVVLPDFFSPDCCIAATAVGIAVLRKIGYEAEPVPVRVSIHNAAYRANIQAGRVVACTEEEMNAFGDGSWSIGIGYGKRQGGYPGHLIIKTRAPGTSDWLVDLTLQQASRPTRDIRLKPVYRPWPEGIAKGRYGPGIDVNGSAVFYQYHPDDRDAAVYLTSRDWVNTGRHYEPIEQILYVMNKTLHIDTATHDVSR